MRYAFAFTWGARMEGAMTEQELKDQLGHAVDRVAALEMALQELVPLLIDLHPNRLSLLQRLEELDGMSESQHAKESRPMRHLYQLAGEIRDAS